jgi:hypothetical protein
MTQDDLERVIEQQRRHILLLQQLSDATGAMSAAATPDEVAAIVLTVGLRALEADAGYLALLDEPAGVLRVSRFAGYEAIPVERLELPADSDEPVAQAARLRTAIYHHEHDVSVPLMVSEDLPPLGAINLRWKSGHDLSRGEQRLLELLAERCSQAMVRAQRMSDERSRRIAAEHALTTSRALELNDGIVQLIAQAKLAAELGLTEQTTEALDQALAAGKRMVASMTGDSVTFRRDAFPLEGVLRVDGDTASSSSTGA